MKTHSSIKYKSCTYYSENSSTECLIHFQHRCYYSFPHNYSVLCALLLIYANPKLKINIFILTAVTFPVLLMLSCY